MKAFFPTLFLLSSIGLIACRETPVRSDSSESTATESESKAAVVSLPDEVQIKELQNEIDSGRQAIENIEAFVDMERAKLDENPDYEQSFMLEALDEQRAIREKVEANEKRLRDIAGPEK